MKLFSDANYNILAKYLINGNYDIFEKNTLVCNLPRHFYMTIARYLIDSKMYQVLDHIAKTYEWINDEKTYIVFSCMKKWKISLDHMPFICENNVSFTTMQLYKLYNYDNNSIYVANQSWINEKLCTYIHLSVIKKLSMIGLNYIYEFVKPASGITYEMYEDHDENVSVSRHEFALEHLLYCVA